MEWHAAEWALKGATERGVRQTCAPLNGQKQFKEVEHQPARPTRLARLTRLDGSATLTECPMDGSLDPGYCGSPPSPRRHSARCPVANHNSIVSTCHLQDTGAEFRQRPSIIQSRWHLPIFPAITPRHCRPVTPPEPWRSPFPGQTKQLMACKLKQVFGAPHVCVPHWFFRLYISFNALASATALRRGCRSCGLISAVCHSAMWTNLCIGQRGALGHLFISARPGILDPGLHWLTS